MGMESITHQYAIYNCDKQQLIALFNSNKDATIFVYGKLNYNKKENIICNSARKKSKILNRSSQLPCNISVRFANPEQIEMLQYEDCLIFDNEYEIFMPPINTKRTTRREFAIRMENERIKINKMKVNNITESDVDEGGFDKGILKNWN